jgi:DNA-binding protein HU-beta
MGTVNKGDLIREAAAKANVTAAAAKEVIDALLDMITEHAEAGDTVAFIGFGKFSVKARPARTGRNPATGNPVEIPESRKLTFKAAAKKAA